MSKSDSCNLLCKGWIPVVWRRDAAREKLPKVGIREALERAHDIQCISHTSPFIEFGLYRLLITIVLDAYIVAGQRPTVGKMKAMIKAGRFDESVLSKYLDTYKDHFQLWSERHPFLQMPKSNRQPEAVSKMVAPVPSGTKIAFWHHYTEDETSLNEEEAAQELCAVAPFCFDYAPKDICTLGGDPPLYILVYGASLFETIVYNLPRPSGRLTVRQELEGGPTWRCPVQGAAGIPRAPTLAQGWTWPVRQIRLIRSGDSSMVGEAVNTAGAGKTSTKQRVRGWRDPNSGTITSAEGIRHIRANGLIPRFTQSSDQNPIMFWRDLVPMCLIGSKGEVLRGEAVRSRPEVVTNALRIADGTPLRLAAYGFIDKGGKNNKVFRTWFRSVLKLPTEVARDNRLSARAIDEFKTTQKVADAFETALRMLRPPAKAGKGKRSPPARGDTDALAQFWHSLELAVTRTYLDKLAEGSEEAEGDLRERIRQEAWDAFTRASDPHRRTADGLFRIANASNWFEGRLNRLLPEPRQGEETMSNDDPFIRYLYSLKHEDAGTLAALRRACGQRLAESRNCQRFASISAAPADFLTATLVAQYSAAQIQAGKHHTTYKGRGSIGAAWADYCRRRKKEEDPATFYAKRQNDLASGGSPDNIPSIHERFRTLLDAELGVDGTGELAYRLRGLVRMLVAEDIPIDLVQLAKDLRGWRAESRYVQERWAKAFYGPPSPGKAAGEAFDEQDEKEELETQDQEEEDENAD